MSRSCASQPRRLVSLGATNVVPVNLRAGAAGPVVGAKTVGHWHSHPDGDTKPSNADLRVWADALKFELTDVFVGVIVTEGTPLMCLSAWTVSERDGKRSASRPTSLPERI